MTAYIDGITGSSYYAKPIPLVTSPSWDTDDIALTENGTTGEFSFSNDATKAYWVFKRSGASPASTDQKTHHVAVEPSESSGTIEGDNEITAIVTDSADDEPIPGATVRYYRTGQAGGGALQTDGDGERIFGLDTATWKWIASAEGYVTQTGTLVVDGDDDHSIELVTSLVTVADAPRCNVVLPVTDQYLSPAPDVLVCIEFLQYLPAATKTAVLVNHPPAIASDAEGLVEVVLARQAKYRATYTVSGESPKRVEFTTPNAGSYTVVEA